ncbi:hypothetical protein JYU34_010669 [Plutella xylostella]|uniref:Uncharacterized protein n=1 Tax=Plutella xylostella TaxID=51655 RepID=A0ABQ7QF14_PLUXY|nr:hypothetical protein JYU34_010669 [Plutella xylostella]
MKRLGPSLINDQWITHCGPPPPPPPPLSSPICLMDGAPDYEGDNLIVINS